MPRFSRRRHRRSRGGALFIGGKTIMKVPDDISFSDGGIITQAQIGAGSPPAANVVVIPMSAPSQYGTVQDNCVAELAMCGLIGRYNFDFTRWLTQSVGAQIGVSPTVQSLAAFFEHIRLGSAYMTFRFIGPSEQVGMTWWNTDLAGTSAPLPVNLGKANVKMHYIMLNPHEATYFQIATDRKIFMADPRRRSRVCRPGRSIRFKFQPLKFLPPPFLSGYTRDMAATIGGEQVKQQRFSFEPRYKRLGWVPTPYVIQTAPSTDLPTPPGSNVGQPWGVGLGAQWFRLMSRTLLVMFESDMLGRIYAANIPPAPPGAGSPYSAYFPSNMSSILVRREEYCSARFRGSRLSNSISTAGVGEIAMVKAYNTTYGIGFTPNMQELFSPPYVETLVNTPGNPPLFRLGDTVGAVVQQAITLPVHVERIPVPWTQVPPLPAGSALP